VHAIAIVDRDQRRRVGGIAVARAGDFVGAHTLLTYTPFSIASTCGMPESSTPPRAAANNASNSTQPRLRAAK
jgi:hypothetical protein